MTEPLQPGDPDEAEELPPVPDPPDTDPIPEEDMVRGLIEDADRDRALVAEWDVTLPTLEEESEP